jgi:hypothetical protein
VFNRVRSADRVTSYTQEAAGLGSWVGENLVLSHTHKRSRLPRKGWAGRSSHTQEAASPVVVGGKPGSESHTQEVQAPPKGVRPAGRVTHRRLPASVVGWKAPGSESHTQEVQGFPKRVGQQVESHTGGCQPGSLHSDQRIDLCPVCRAMLQTLVRCGRPQRERMSCKTHTGQLIRKS